MLADNLNINIEKNGVCRHRINNRSTFCVIELKCASIKLVILFLSLMSKDVTTIPNNSEICVCGVRIKLGFNF